MAWNLRSDLARLPDSEIATRCEALWREIDTLGQDKRARRHASGTRGFLRHPRAYMFWGIFRLSGGGLLEALVSALVPSPKAGDKLTGTRAVSLHVALCELQDLIDEMKARRSARGEGDEQDRT
ncbi:hypothetical protein [Xanthobacter autotrophicus]|uniref:hypothetical protein n=1 Tax=Xanthobacter autotrophicus TaxID=280 RepID=UPI0024A6450D|nr:hypothetical protein [Xanthobacter autotrophicus]MDI4656637.1 hypothetical protein [Xanthobacter autotrophicus]